MKHLWFGLGLIAALFALCIGTFFLLRGATAQTLQFLEQAQDAQRQEDPNAALYYSTKAQAAWERQEGLIDAIMSHEETDDIHREFSDLLVYAERREAADFLSSCGKLLVMVEHLTEMERLVWRNIL